MKKLLFLGILFICSTAFVNKEANLSNSRNVSIKSESTSTTWVFDHTFVGLTRSGCRIYFTGIAQTFSDGSYCLELGFKAIIDCRPTALVCSARINSERTEVLESRYSDSETDEEINEEESSDMDKIVLSAIRNLK